MRYATGWPQLFLVGRSRHHTTYTPPLVVVAHRVHRLRGRAVEHTLSLHPTHKFHHVARPPPAKPSVAWRAARLSDRRRYEEGGAEAGRARRQAEAEGAQGRLGTPRHRPDERGHEGPEVDSGRQHGPRRRRRQAAQVLPRGVHRLRRPSQGGEEGRR